MPWTKKQIFWVVVIIVISILIFVFQPAKPLEDDDRMYSWSNASAEVKKSTASDFFWRYKNSYETVSAFRKKGIEENKIVELTEGKMFACFEENAEKDFSIKTVALKCIDKLRKNWQ